MGGPNDKPLVLITGAAGNLGRSIAGALADSYRIVGLDKETGAADFPILAVDLTDADAVHRALAEVAEDHGRRFASVVHLAAFFDFSGEEHPLYETLNVAGTRHLLRALADHEVEQFLYASTMLVHAPARPGERIDEDRPIDPRWAYPRSKAEAEKAIAEAKGDIPVTILRLAGVYDEETMVPTLAHQMARVYERDFQSHFYSGSTDVGQAMLHRDDMLDAVRRAVDRRADLADTAILVGEPEAPGYGEIQDILGRAFHGEEEWTTIRLPKPVAAAGAWAQDRLEPVIPDAIDRGEAPFIKPFMVRMADDHYALDISRAERLLGWRPGHRLVERLPVMAKALKDDPAGWYEANGITPPEWLETADEMGLDPEEIRRRHDAEADRQHGAFRWAHFVNIALGSWLVTQPALIGLAEPWLAGAEIGLGAALILFASLSLSRRFGWARWICAGIGLLVMAAPFVLWTASGPAYLSDTLIGMAIAALALCAKPDPGVSPLAATSGPDLPPGWSYNPSDWSQRIPIIALALVGLYVSRYLAAYQLGHVDGVWEPFFAGDPADPRNATEEIITSYVAEAWPVPDAAVGAYVYALEIITGSVGSRQRWRTMPWLVILFGILIVPLGVVSIFFIVIQPIWLGAWSTLALVGAAAMLIQIPYSIDELLASLQFLRRRARAGRNWLRVLFVGDTDDGGRREEKGDAFAGPPLTVMREMMVGGVNLPWSLKLAALLGLSLLFTRLTLGAEGSMADADHLVGALVLTVVSISAAEVARAVRFLLVPLGLALGGAALMLGDTGVQTAAGLIVGAALVALAFPRGRITGRYGSWDPLIR